jgi:mercuric ion transport protein
MPATPHDNPSDGADGTVSDIESRRSGLLAGAGLLGALLASSCCIVPLAFVTLGISGAWMSNLTALEPYKPYFVAVTLLMLGAGFWQVYIRPRRACAAGSYCASPASGRISRTLLWLATAIVLLAATINYWAPLFY